METGYDKMGFIFLLWRGRDKAGDIPAEKVKDWIFMGRDVRRGSDLCVGYFVSARALIT